MLKVLRNLKNSWITVLIIVILLCVQAATDLALPDYTSKIVNVGIQYGGIEDAIPEVISNDVMEDLLFFTEDDDKILENYDLVKENPNSYQEKIIKKYLGENYNLGASNLFILKALDDEQKSNLESLLVSPLVEYGAVTNEETAKQIKEQIMQKMSEDNATLEKQTNGQPVNLLAEREKIDNSQLEDEIIKGANKHAQVLTPDNIQNISIMEILENMPEEQKTIVLDQFTNKLNQISDSLKQQAAIGEVKTIYSNMGIDTDKLQNNYILVEGLQMLSLITCGGYSAITSPSFTTFFTKRGLIIRPPLAMAL